MIYATGLDEATGEPVDLSDTHSRLGRMTVTHQAAVTDELILEVLTAENTAEVAVALSAALEGPGQRTPIAVAPKMEASNPRGVESPASETAAVDADQGPLNGASVPAKGSAAKDDVTPSPTTAGTQSGRASNRAVSGGAPAAVLHTDGLWLADGTRVELGPPIVHVGQVAELAYTHHLGYRLTAKYNEPGQIWITEAACQEFGIDVAAISRRDRAKSLRQLTENIDFVTGAVNEGWSLGGAGRTLTLTGWAPGPASIETTSAV